MKNKIIITGLTVALSLSAIVTIFASYKIISKDELISIIRTQVPDGVIKSIDLDYEHDLPRYEIEVEKGNAEYEINVDAITGKIIYIDVDEDDDDDENYNGNNYNVYYGDDDDDNTRILSTNISIGMDNAKAIALEEVPNATITEINLKNKFEVPVYEIEMVNAGIEYEITVDANTGKVIDKDIDYYDNNGYVESVITKVDVESAKSIALKSVPDSTFEFMKLDYKNNRNIYDIKLMKNYVRYIVKIDADTGEILHTHKYNTYYDRYDD